MWSYTIIINPKTNTTKALTVTASWPRISPNTSCTAVHRTFQCIICAYFCIQKTLVVEHLTLQSTKPHISCNFHCKRTCELHVLPCCTTYGYKHNNHNQPFILQTIMFLLTYSCFGFAARKIMLYASPFRTELCNILCIYKRHSEPSNLIRKIVWKYVGFTILQRAIITYSCIGYAARNICMQKYSL